MFPQRLMTKFFAFLVTATVTMNSVQAEFYRWVDDEGTIHYSDSLPPQQSQREQDVINEYGRTVKTISAPKTDAELKEEARLAKIEEEKRKQQQVAEHRDRTLLAMYLSVDDIELVRDERLATVDSAIEITKLRKKKFIKKLQDLDASEQRLKENGTGTPEWLKKSREHYKSQLANVERILEIKEREKLTIKKRFSGEINRYIELKEPGLAAQ